LSTPPLRALAVGSLALFRGFLAVFFQGNLVVSPGDTPPTSRLLFSPPLLRGSYSPFPTGFWDNLFWPPKFLPRWSSNLQGFLAPPIFGPLQSLSFPAVPRFLFAAKLLRSLGRGCLFLGLSNSPLRAWLLWFGASAFGSQNPPQGTCSTVFPCSSFSVETRLSFGSLRSLSLRHAKTCGSLLCGAVDRLGFF